MENCKNCSQLIEANFCSNCGQKKYKRINKKYVFDEVQYTFLHTNKGLLYSVKKILINPGKIAKDFIDGNRVNHYKPILLTFVLSGIAAFLAYKVVGTKDILNAYYVEKKMNSKFMADVMTIISSYSSMLMILLVPFFALTTKIAFRKWGHNYYEHIVMNSYILSYYTVITILIFHPIMFYLRHGSPTTFFKISQIPLLLVPLILVWFFKEFYSEKPLKKIILRVLAIIALVILGYILLIILVAVGVGIYTLLNGPEAIKYLKP